MEKAKHFAYAGFNVDSGDKKQWKYDQKSW